MKIEKRPSGKYRIRKMVNGKVYQFTLDHKPSQNEILKLIAEKVTNCNVSNDMPFKQACDLYIESKSNVLSVTTISGYNAMIKKLSPGLLNEKLSNISPIIVQTEINQYSIGHAPKTVKNMSGFIMGVLNYYNINVASPKLPQNKKINPYIPSKKEVHEVLNSIKNTKIEIPVLLGCMGLRRSEICALTLDDLSKDNTLTINKALVLDSNRKWIIKPTKTTDSTREIVIPDYLADLIRKQGYIYDGYPGKITEQLNLVQKRLNIQRFSLHKLRHFFASYMHDLGYSDKQIQEMGGWKNSNVLRSIYTHAMDIEEAKRQAANDISALL